MSEFTKSRRLIEVTLLFVTSAMVVSAQSFMADLKAEHDPGKRSELALTMADTAFDNARDFYTKGDDDKGDALLEDMTTALNECVTSLSEAHKAKFYKRAELKVAYLQRRMDGLMEDIDVQRRGWAEQTQRRLDEIHDKLLEGVMRK